MVRNKGNKEVMAIGTYAELDKEWAEVAFVVREDFHGQGIAGHLLQALEKLHAPMDTLVYCLYSAREPCHDACVYKVLSPRGK